MKKARTRFRIPPAIMASLIIAAAGALFSRETFADTDAGFMLKPAEISIKSGTLYYDGDISQESWRILSDLAESGATQDIRHMVITSPGGDTRAGRSIGRWVQENIALLEVEKICFSSCANYVFPAADRKIIREGSFVGWHGTERTAEILALSQPGVTAADAEREELRKALLVSEPDLEGTAELEDIIATEMERAASSRIDEVKFFAGLKIDDTLAYYGILPEQLPEYEASGFAGWTFSPEDMACFGVDNVEYAGPGAYQVSETVRVKVHVFDLPGRCE